VHSDALESDVVFVSIASLWIRGSVLVPIFHFAYGHHPHVRTFKISTCWTIQPKTNVIPFRIFGVLSIGKNSPHVGHGTTATTGPLSASPFTEPPHDRNREAYLLQGSAAENLLTTVSKPTHERQPPKKQRNRVASTVVDRSHSNPLGICPSETFLHLSQFEDLSAYGVTFISAHQPPPSAQRRV
jgi:hypothetical protein